MYSNKSPFKNYISILGGWGGLRPCLFCLLRGVQNLGKPVYIILARSPTYGMLGGVVDEVGFLQKGHFLLSN